MKFYSLLFTLAVAICALAGCDNKSEIKVYRVSKAPLEESAGDQEMGMPTNAATPPMGGAMAPATTSAAAGVATPPGWEPQPLSQMRQASFVVKGANGAVVDISLVSLGAAAGGQLDNVNRWLGQLGQPPVTAEKLTQMAERVSTSLGDVVVVDLAGLPNGADAAKDGRIIAAMTSTGASTLFFKMRGNAELTEAQKGDFMKWVAAVCNGQGGGGNSAAPMTTTGAGPASDTPPQIKWKTPAGWTEVPAAAMRYASFTVPGQNGGKLDVSVVTFPGDGGSDADNVNRWRRQIGLSPLDEKAMASLVTPLDAGESKFSTLDMAAGDSRVVAAWLRRDNRSWFFKMSGPSALVDREKPKFMEFLRSVDFHS